MNFVEAVKQSENTIHTTNGAVARTSTLNKVYDLFALGAAYRSRTESECLRLFTDAYNENPDLAIKCLTYLRDIAEGQGERRFFRVCLRWLGTFQPDVIKRNIMNWVSGNYIRWDDLFVLFGTRAEKTVMSYIQKQLVEDMSIYNASANGAVSLCAKWMPSENTSCAETRKRARRVIQALGLAPREYRKMLSMLRERINVVERLMSLNRWEEIDFSKLPSRAGLIYRNAFKNKGLIAEKYREFAQDKDTKVNAKTLYPYDVVCAARKVDIWDAADTTERLMVNKYWNNLTDYFKGATLNAMVVCDTSGSMRGGCGNVAPIDVAISLAMYTAERANGPFKNHYISFSSRPQLIETTGTDFCDKVERIYRTNLCENTNLEATFDLIATTARNYELAPSEVPETLIIISDMQIDSAVGYNPWWHQSSTKVNVTTMQQIRTKWDYICQGRYKFPKLIYWNVNASQNTFLDDQATGISYVSGCSPVLYEQILKGKTGIDLMLDKLNSPRYETIGY
jgi:hypothetical protein